MSEGAKELPTQPEISEQALMFARDLAAERAKSRGLLVRIGQAGIAVRRLLVADDDPALRLIVSTTLDGEGYDVYEAKDGAEALALIYELRPDVVLLDVDMPGLTGLDVCKHIRADATIKDTRVVMLSARAESSEQAAGLEAGANQYLTKPFRPMQLINTIAQAMRES